jgi:hypothetical protein
MLAWSIVAFDEDPSKLSRPSEHPKNALLSVSKSNAFSVGGDGGLEPLGIVELEGPRYSSTRRFGFDLPGV